jgi:hypothetical protein
MPKPFNEQHFIHIQSRYILILLINNFIKKFLTITIEIIKIFSQFTYYKELFLNFIDLNYTILNPYAKFYL